MSTESKVCNTCHIEQPLFNFYEHKGARSSPGYRNPRCKKCHSISTQKWVKNNPTKVKHIRAKAKLKEKYGISLEEYQTLYEKQQGKCYLCSVVPTRNRALNVDHCHTTNKVRKLLCDKCNLALGLLNDDIQLLQKMIVYLNENSTV